MFYIFKRNSLSQMVTPFGMPMVHIITANAERHRIAFFTPYRGAIAPTQTTVDRKWHPGRVVH